MNDFMDFDIELNFQKDDVRKTKEKIRKQRSSIGRCLASQSHALSSCITDSINQIPLDTKPVAKNTDSSICEGSVAGDITSTETSANIDTSEKIKFYKNREQALKCELSDWKELCKVRKQQYLEAKGRYNEADNKVAIIDDSQMKYLTRKQKDFLLAKPDYGSYLQVVRDLESDFVCKLQQVIQTTNIIEEYLNVLKISNDARYAIYEKEFVECSGPTTKEIIRQLTTDGTITESQIT